MNAVCMGCGCTDETACAGGCSWLRLDEDTGEGVCSNCPEIVSTWDFEHSEDDTDELVDRRPGELILPGDPEFHL